jgi:S1-C subfamily serine protease
MSGIVSQILAHEPTCSNEPKSAALLLSDAVVFLGTQGGPVFDALTKRFIGIVVPSIESLPSTTHRPVLTPIIPVQSILQMIHHLPMKCPKSFLTLDQHHHHAHKAVHKAIKSVVLLRTNARSWATGVLLNDAGLLLTAGHVLLNETIQVEALVVVVPGCSSHLRSQWRSTNVLYVASNRTIDIALLQIEFNKSENRLCPQYHVPYTWKSRPPTVGTRIFSIGFPTMDPFSSSFSSTYTTGNPLVTSGIVSKLVSLPEDPSFLVMIRTSARIMNGHSGGMLVDATDGSFLGLIVSNLEWQTTNDHSRRMIIEQINASLPMCSILSGCQVLCRNEFTVSTTSTSGSTIMQEVMEVMEHPWKNQEKAIGRLWAGSEEKSSTRLHNTLQSSSTTKKIITSASSLLSSL